MKPYTIKYFLNKFFCTRARYFTSKIKPLITKFTFPVRTLSGKQELKVQEILKSFLTENKEYEHKIELSFEVGSLLTNVYNKDSTWKEIDKILFEMRYSGRRHLASVWGLSGKGKTFTLENYPLFCDSEKKKDILFSYITMNALTPYLDTEIYADQILTSRILFDFLHKCGVLVKFTDIRSKPLQNISVEVLISYLKTLTNKKDFLVAVDEVVKIINQDTRKQIMTRVGSLLDFSIDNFAIISTLNLGLTIKYSTEIKRNVKYVNLHSITDLLDNIDNEINIKDLCLRKYDTLFLLCYEMSAIPRRLNYFLYDLKEKSHEELKRLNENPAEAEEMALSHLDESVNLNDIPKYCTFYSLESAFAQKKIKNQNDLVGDSNIRYFDIFASGLFIEKTANDTPIVNPLILKSILAENLSKIENWTPAYDYWEILNLYPDFNISNKQGILSSSFENLVIRIDIMLRKYIYYNNKLFPNFNLKIYDYDINKLWIDKLSSTTRPGFISYDDLFPGSSVTENSLKFKQFENYEISTKYNIYSYKSTNETCVSYFTSEDYMLLLKGTVYYVNVLGGKGFDKLKLDFTEDDGIIIRFFQDKFNSIDADSRERTKTVTDQVKKTLQNLKEIKKDIIKNLLIIFPNKNIYSEVVFYAYYKIDKKECHRQIAQLKEIKHWSIILIDEELFKARFEGLLDSRLEFLFKVSSLYYIIK